MSRIRAAVLLLALVALAGFGLSGVTLNVDVLALLPSSLPEIHGVRLYHRHFSRPDELIVTLESTGPEASPETLTNAAASLADALGADPDLASSVIRRLPYDAGPESAAELLAYLWLNAPPDAVASLERRLAPDRLPLLLDDLVEELAAGILDQESYLRAYDPLGFASPPFESDSTGMALPGEGNTFVSSDGNFRAIYVTAPPGAAGNYQLASEWISRIRARVASWETAWLSAHPEVAAPRISFTGEPAFVAEIGTGIERDLKGSVTTTTVLICLLFWLLHRRLLPLFWLALLLLLVFSLTLAIGGLIFGELSIMSAGFAAILIGLTVDYAVVLYREARLTPGDAPALRRLAGPGIGWASVTTAAVFFALNFSGFPGVSQLGVLVAIGILVGASVMLLLFAPIAVRQTPAPNPGSNAHSDFRGIRRIVTGFVPAAFLATLGVTGLPSLQEDFKPLQLRVSPAMEALETMERQLLDGGRDFVPLLVSAPSADAMPDRIDRVRQRLEKGVATEMISRFILPGAVFPNAANQQANAEALSDLLEEQTRVTDAVGNAGFTGEALVLTMAVFDAWRKQIIDIKGNGGTWVMPREETARWIVDRLVSFHDQECVVLGQVLPGPNWDGKSTGNRKLMDDGIHLAGWDSLNAPIHDLIRRDLTRLFLPVGLGLVAILALVFRDWRDLTLCVFTLAFAGGAILTLSLWIGQQWNAFNLCGIPILFGIGLDYGIHMIFALRRNRGQLGEIRAGIARALVFCGFSTAIGFGSLSLASSQGLATLGRICSLGILINMAVAVWLLPHWWRTFHRISD